VEAVLDKLGDPHATAFALDLDVKFHGERIGLLHIEERPRPGRKHLANVVQVASREWRAWIDRRPARPKEPIPRSASSRAPRPVGLIGVKKPSTTARRF
jgi:hypothetical protein